MLPEFGYGCDVGANNGWFLSNTKYFEDMGWEILCVEPNPLLVEEAKKIRKRWVQAACGPEDSDSVTFTALGEYPWAGGSGFTPEVINGQHGLKKTEYQVPMRTLNRLLTEAGFPRLDLLSVDVELYELEVLAGIDLLRWGPYIIIMESLSVEKTSKITDYLYKNSYDFICVREFDHVFRRR